MANHLGLDFDLVELLARVDTDDRADHLGDNDHVTEVGLDEVGLLVGLGLLLGLAELLDQTHGLALETAVEPSAGTGVDEVAELLRAEVEELLEVDSTVGELLEGAFGLDGCGVLSAFVLHLSTSMLRVHLHSAFRPSCATCILHCVVLKGEKYRGELGGGLRRGVGVGERAYRRPPRRSVLLLAGAYVIPLQTVLTYSESAMVAVVEKLES